MSDDEYIYEEEEIELSNKDKLELSLQEYIYTIKDLNKIEIGDEIVLILSLINNWQLDLSSKILLLKKNPLGGELNFRKATCEICLINSVIYIPEYSCCNHDICIMCYKQELYSSIKMGYPKKCIYPGCNKEMIYLFGDIKFILNNMELMELKQTIKDLILDSYLKSYNCLFMKCINPKCDSLLYNECNAEILECKYCGIRICFKCKNEYHLPASCENNKIWMDSIKMYDMNESEKWIALNCKKCPNPDKSINCNTPIEKIKSCLKMKCYNCKYEFCWKCLKDYSTHTGKLSKTGFYICPVKEIENNMLDNKLIIDYFMFNDKYKEMLKTLDFNYKNVYLSKIDSICFVYKILSNFIIFYNFNKSDLLQAIILDKFKSLVLLIDFINNATTKDPLFDFKTSIYYSKVCILTNYLINITQIETNSSHTKIQKISHEDKEPDISFWFSPDLPPFNIEQQKLLELNYYLLIYNFNDTQFNYDILNYKISPLTDLTIKYDLKRLIKEEFICKFCTFKNNPQFGIDNICELCENNN